MNEEELKKGCGKDLKRKAFENPSLSLYCGIEVFVSESVGLKVILCPTCQAKLLQRKEDVKEFNKFVQELKDIEIWDCSPDEYLDRINQCKRKLDKQLQKEIGEEK